MEIERWQINGMMFIIFIVLAAALWIATSQATQYMTFCRDNDYNTAGNHRRGYGNTETACYELNDENIAYRRFQCDPECHFTEPKGYINTTEYDLNGIPGIPGYTGDYNYAYQKDKTAK